MFFPGMEQLMSHTISPSPRTRARRIDALLALPLARFRRALADLPAEELAALDARIVLQRIRSSWARGGAGIARHRAPHELGLLARREAALRFERDTRLASSSPPIRLVPHESGMSDPIGQTEEKRAA